MTAWSCLAVSLLTVGCANAPAERGAPTVDPALAQYVLGEMPRDVQHRTFIDFEGKLQLLGYDIEPATSAVRPGERFKLRLYWRSSSALRPGWSLFTHVLDGAGQNALNADRFGPLRSPGADGVAKLPLHGWQPGKIYVDEQEIEMPRSIRSAATVVVGAWRPPLITAEDAQDEKASKHGGLRLQVISGPHDGSNRGIVLHIDTGISPPPRVVRSRKT
jgi:hypothetical protein